jgi:uncharacterized protein with PIN domain
MAATTATNTEADYVTYAPDGSRCADCNKEIRRLEPCRRFTAERQSGSPAAVYRHFECPA